MDKLCRFIVLLISISMGSYSSLWANKYDIVNCESQKVGYFVEIFEDSEGVYSGNEVPPDSVFQKTKTEIPNFGVTESIYWIKLAFTNKGCDAPMFLVVENPGLDEIVYFGSETIPYSVGVTTPMNERLFKSNFYFFELNSKIGESEIIYLKVRNTDQVQIPITVGSAEYQLKRQSTRDLFFGLYSGIFLVMVLYNLIISAYTRDSTYLYYVIFCIAVYFNQVCILGYGSRVFWGEYLEFEKYAIFVFSSISAPLAILFFIKFLDIRKRDKLIISVLGFFIIWYFLNLVLSFLGHFLIAGKSIEMSAGLLSISQLVITIVFVRRGSRQAKFFLVSWLVFLIGVIVYVLKDFGVLPYNELTNSMMAIGTSLEVILLSIALADRINVLRKEKEMSQLRTLEIIKENERIITEQNIILESKVDERTKELIKSNDELSGTLTDLKNTQAQLVDAEKMASLGQLTAGIAHELNNPINFVSANVTPLERDIEDLFILLKKYQELEESPEKESIAKEISELKKEIELPVLEHEIPTLLKGIKEGATRSTEIIKGLKIFSRLDQQDLKKVDINECIESTLIVLRSVFKHKVRITKDLQNIEPINCFPGKINQVFMNVLNNSVQALLETNLPPEEKVIEISTFQDDINVIIRIKDNGPGMDEVTKQKIFDPFFTTKAVGEGTGLGLSIVLGIINDHNGKIEVNSSKDEGTEFIITLPNSL